MIDPKLNELPAEGKRSSVATPEQQAPRRGLSINDTVAAEANRSVGGAGADTSGVRSGAGAAAGSALLTPETGNTLNEAGSTALNHDEIASHAYHCWHERGCPEGSSEEDWHRAERELRERSSSK